MKKPKQLLSICYRHMLANDLDVRILLHCNLEIRKISQSAFNKNNDNIHRIRIKIVYLVFLYSTSEPTFNVSNRISIK